MKFENVYFINGTAYAGKSTMVKLLAEKYDGIACEENYQDRLLENLDTKEFPNLTYTRDLQDWGEFVRRTPDEYEAWVNGVTKECTVLEIEILKDLVSRTKKKIFVDTNIYNEIIYVFLTIFLYLLKCPQSFILSALRAFCFCGKPRISRSIFLYFRYQAWLKSW